MNEMKQITLAMIYIMNKIDKKLPHKIKSEMLCKHVTSE